MVTAAKYTQLLFALCDLGYVCPSWFLHHGALLPFSCLEIRTCTSFCLCSGTAEQRNHQATSDWLRLGNTGCELGTELIWCSYAKGQKHIHKHRNKQSLGWSLRFVLGRSLFRRIYGIEIYVIQFNANTYHFLHLMHKCVLMLICFPE